MPARVPAEAKELVLKTVDEAVLSDAVGEHDGVVARHVS